MQVRWQMMYDEVSSRLNKILLKGSFTVVDV